MKQNQPACDHLFTWVGDHNEVGNDILKLNLPDFKHLLDIEFESRFTSGRSRFVAGWFRFQAGLSRFPAGRSRFQPGR